MAVTSITEQIDDMYVSTWRARRKKVVDQVFKATPFYMKMTENGRKEPEDGGRSIEEPLSYGKNKSVQWIGKGGTVSLEDTEKLSAANYDWNYLTGHIIRRFQDWQKNRGKHQIINKVNRDIDNLRNSLIEDLEIALFGDGTADDGKQLDGLKKLVQKDPTSSESVGNINQSNYSWWQNQYTDMSGEEVSLYLIKRMRTMYNDCAKLGQGNRFPDLIITDQSTYEFYEEEAQQIGTIRHTNDQQMIDLGFGDLAFKGADLVWSDYCPANSMYFLNTDYLRFVYDPSEYLNLGDFLPIYNQPRDKVAHSMTCCQLTCSNRAKQGIIFNIGQ